MALFKNHKQTFTPGECEAVRVEITPAHCIWQNAVVSRVDGDDVWVFYYYHDGSHSHARKLVKRQDCLTWGFTLDEYNSGKVAV